jgi:hypothetical protein
LDLDAIGQTLQLPLTSAVAIEAEVAVIAVTAVAGPSEHLFF